MIFGYFFIYFSVLHWISFAQFLCIFSVQLAVSLCVLGVDTQYFEFHLNYSWELGNQASAIILQSAVLG